MEAYSILKNGNEKLSEHFKVREFYCRDGSDPVFIDTALVEVLEKIRTHFGKPVTITSGFRTASWNAKQKNAAKFSQHLYGKAADIQASAWSRCMPTRTNCWATSVAAAFTRPVLDAPTAGCMWTCAKPRADGRGERRWKASLPPSSAVL